MTATTRKRPGFRPLAALVSGVLAAGGLAAGATTGFVVVRAGGFMARRLTRARTGSRRAAGRLLSLGSACVVLALGCGLVFKGAASALG
ncbi:MULTISPECIES: hypothetical protein [unclassified Streptomyces]|uniref:hypothetical protein n=1 Tax=unclassified Streptomyces TaxID=2593676 RepID=UPI000DBA5A96|nr:MULTISPECIES: hypothetical protein [unclassified Streptomyces]MYT72845.1 hypothetical protein [Streptomyces sp. SID8367]RAJ78822.1 hypothetical protein K377_05428 [Streptomyces sp. PsTaAH-137]